MNIYDSIDLLDTTKLTRIALLTQFIYDANVSKSDEFKSIAMMFPDVVHHTTIKRFLVFQQHKFSVTDYGRAMFGEIHQLTITINSQIAEIIKTSFTKSDRINKIHALITSKFSNILEYVLIHHIINSHEHRSNYNLISNAHQINALIRQNIKNKMHVINHLLKSTTVSLHEYDDLEFWDIYFIAITFDDGSLCRAYSDLCAN